MDVSEFIAWAWCMIRAIRINFRAVRLFLASLQSFSGEFPLGSLVLDVTVYCFHLFISFINSFIHCIHYLLRLFHPLCWSAEISTLIKHWILPKF